MHLDLQNPPYHPHQKTKKTSKLNGKDWYDLQKYVARSQVTGGNWRSKKTKPCDLNRVIQPSLLEGPSGFLPLTPQRSPLLLEYIGIKYRFFRMIPSNG